MISSNRTSGSKEGHEPIHIAMIEPVGGYGGMQSYDYGLCNALGHSGARVTLYTCEHAPPRADSFQTVLAFRKVFGKGAKLWRALRYAVGLTRTVFAARAKPNSCVHFHFFRASPLEYFAIRVTRLLRLPIVVTVHDVESLCGTSSSRLTRPTYDGANALIAHNELTRSELRSDLKIDDEKIAIVPHGNYLSDADGAMTRDAARQRLGLAPEDRVLLFFGQIKRVKGLDVLLKALPEVVACVPRLRLIIAGRVWKDDFEVYRRLIDDLNLKSVIVDHIRYIPDEEVPVFFSAADMVVLPYLKIYQSGVLLLGMSYSRAVLASDLPGMREVITDGEDGFLFRSGDSADLANRIVDALNNETKLNQVAQNGYATARDRFSWDAIGERTMDVYRSILK